MSHKLVVQSNNTELLIEYIDDYYNIYRLVVYTTDPIVHNLLNGDVTRLQHLLEDNIQFIIHDNGKCIAFITEPITIKYTLLIVNKSSNCDKVNLLTKSVTRLNSTNDILTTKINDLEDMIRYYGIPKPWGSHAERSGRFEDRVINMDSVNQSIHINDPSKIFDLSPLKWLPLTSLDIYIQMVACGHKDSKYYISEDKYLPILNCKQLQQFKLKYDPQDVGCIKNLTNLNFLKELDQLRQITIINATHLVDIDVLYKLPHITDVKFVNCGSIIYHKDQFREDVTVAISSTE